MKIHKIILVAFTILFLLLGTVNASDSDGIADNLLVDGNICDSIENGAIQTSYEDVHSSEGDLCELYAADVDSGSDDSPIFNESDSDSDLEILTDSNHGLKSLAYLSDGSHVLASSKTFNGNSFSLLQSEINNCSVNDTIKLTKDVYQDGFNYISILKSITIDGNGHAIDGCGQSMIFQIRAPVVLKNIVFRNAVNRAINSNSSLVISNCTFANNSGLNGVAIFLMVNDGTIENCTFINNTALQGSGGAIFLQGVSAGNKNVTIKNCRFESNTALSDGARGAAIYSDCENLTIDNCSFSDNSAYAAGAVFNNYICYISNCNFTNNSAGDGGAFYNYYIGVVSNCNFTNNTASKKGNIYNLFNLSLDWDYFEGNSASIGGAVYSEANCSMETCIFNVNSATSAGGALYSKNGSTYLMECDFNNNSASDGGAIYLNNYLGSIDFCNFDENNATGKGGALFLESFDLGMVSLSSFFKNNASYGGAVYCTDSAVDFDYDAFFNNTAENGGAVYCFNSRTIFDLSQFYFNRASADAGAILLNDTNSTIKDSIFESNIAAAMGGAISTVSENASSQLELKGSTFLNNKAGPGSLIVNDTEGILFVQYNQTNNYVNAIYLDFLSSINLTDVTYWSGNQTNSDKEVYNTGAKGHKIVLEAYGSRNELLLNITLTTDPFGQFYYDGSHLNNGNYTYKLYHIEDNYYGYCEASGNFTLNKSTSSISIGIRDHAEFRYNKCSIPFTVVNRTVVRVLVTNENESIVYINRTVDTYSLKLDLDLGVKDSYYKITLFNINNTEYAGSQDTKFFKILQTGSSISFVNFGDVSFGRNISIPLSVENMTEINLTVYDANGDIVYEAIIQNDTAILPVLPVGRYNVTAVNVGNKNVRESNASTSFNVLKADNGVSVSADNVSYGEYALIVVRAQVDGLYQLDVNGSFRTVFVANGIGRVYYVLNPGYYYANVTFDDVNCNNYIYNTNFRVFNADNFVSVSVSNLDKDMVTITINATADGVYLLDVNGSLMNVTVTDGIGIVELSLPAGEYYVNVTFDDDNYNSYINNTTFFKPSNVVIPPVLSEDGQGNIILDLPEGTSGEVTVYVNHDQLASLPVSAVENLIPLTVSDVGENVVSLLFVDEFGYEYEVSTTIYVKRQVSEFDIEFSNDSSVLGFVLHLPDDLTGILNVRIENNVYPINIKDGLALFSLSGLASGSYVVELEYPGDSSYEAFSRGFIANIEQNDIDYGPGLVPVNHTNAGDVHDIQAAIDSASPGDVILLGNYNYVNVSGLRITKMITIQGSGGTTIASAGNGVPIFRVPTTYLEEPVSLNLTGVSFKLKNGDVVIRAIAENDTSPLSIMNPAISVVGNTFDTADDDVVPESIVVVVLESERGILSPNNEISITGNVLTAGIDPFEFEVTSIASGDDVNIVPQNFTLEKKPSVIVYSDMTTTAIDVKTDGRVGEYFKVTLKDEKGNVLAGKKVQIGFNGQIYNRTTNADGLCKLQINLAAVNCYTFAISFLGDDDYDASFVVAKINVLAQKATLTVAKKTYSASARTKSLTATFKSARGNLVKGKKVKFTVNGKTYTATTNANGVATVKISLNKKGTYSFVAKFAGDKTYASISKSSKLTLK